jgi:hypothetical protein
MLNNRFGMAHFQTSQDEVLLQLFDANGFEISATQCPTHYSPAGNGDVLDIVVHMSMSDILDSTCWIMSQQILKPLEKSTDWERFQSLASNFISPNIEIKLI